MIKNRLNHSIEVITWFQAGWAELKKGVSEERRQIWLVFGKALWEKSHGVRGLMCGIAQPKSRGCSQWREGHCGGISPSTNWHSALAAQICCIFLRSTYKLFMFQKRWIGCCQQMARKIYFKLCFENRNRSYFMHAYKKMSATETNRKQYLLQSA